MRRRGLLSCLIYPEQIVCGLFDEWGSWSDADFRLRGRYNVAMAETWGDIVKRLKAVAAERGKPITDKLAEEVITREYRELFPEGFDPIDPAPEISDEEYENMADLTNLDS